MEKGKKNKQPDIEDQIDAATEKYTNLLKESAQAQRKGPIPKELDVRIQAAAAILQQLENEYKMLQDFYERNREKQ